MRVLFTTTGHSGHLLPLVPLARACGRAGHEVMVATYSARADNVERVRLPVHAIAEAPDSAWAHVMEALPGLMQSEGDALIIGEGFARVGGGGVLPGMVAVVDDWRPDVVVHECYEVAGPIAAEARGVPVVRVALGLASTEDWVTRLSAATVADLRSGLELTDEAPARPLVSMVPPGFDDGPAAQRFRDAPPPAAPALPAWWANADDPLVYLTFGSVTGSLPFYPSLYQAALEPLESLPVRVLLTIGRDADIEALGPVPHNIHVEAWVAQHEVLTEAAAVVSHGGYGTTLGAIAHGVPLVLMPLFAGDQWRTARRLAELGVGIVLDEGERRVFEPPGPEVFAALPGAVSALLADAHARDTAQRFAAEMAALRTADAAVATLAAARA